jgi:transposase
MSNSQSSYSFFVGIDLSKNTFDASIVNQTGQKIAYKKFKNNSEGYFLFLTWVGKTTKTQEGILYCMEHTGIYGRLLYHFLQDHSQPLWIDSGLQIKRSGGIQRGKNDKIDSFRIAIYAQEKQHKAKIAPEYDTNIEQMHDLLTTRNRLLTAYNALLTAQEEVKHFDEVSYQAIKQAQKTAIDGLKSSIKQVEKQIDELLEKNPQWHQNVELATSIKGLGKLTVLWFLVYTRNFDEKFNARKLAAFVGVAPYENSSGTSVNNGSHVSFYAHKSLNALLHTATLSALNHNPAIKKYFNRKKAEGKKGFIPMTIHRYENRFLKKG